MQLCLAFKMPPVPQRLRHMSQQLLGPQSQHRYRHGTVKKSSMWLKDSRYEWLELETAPDGENVVGLFCSLCKKHSKLPRNGSATYPPILIGVLSCTIHIKHKGQLGSCILMTSSYPSPPPPSILLWLTL